MDEWTTKTPYPICRLFFKVDLLTDFAALCLTDFIDWRYIHSWLVFSTQVWTAYPHGRRNYTCVLLPLYLLSNLPPPLFYNCRAGFFGSKYGLSMQQQRPHCLSPVGVNDTIPPLILTSSTKVSMQNQWKQASSTLEDLKSTRKATPYSKNSVSLMPFVIQQTVQNPWYQPPNIKYRTTPPPLIPIPRIPESIPRTRFQGIDSKARFTNSGSVQMFTELRKELIPFLP
jgi:hypothetical protein